MTTGNLKTLNIRNVDPETHRKLRLLAAVLNITQPQALKAAVFLALDAVAEIDVEAAVKEAKEQDSLGSILLHQLNKDLK